MLQSPTELSPVALIPDFAVIIRAIHQRDETQIEAVQELAARGLWLSREQRLQAGLGDPN